MGLSRRCAGVGTMPLGDECVLIVKGIEPTESANILSYILMTCGILEPALAFRIILRKCPP